MTNTMTEPTTDTTEIVEDWTKPAAMAIPKEGFFELEQGRYGPIYPKTPACYGFTIIAKIKPGRSRPSANTAARSRRPCRVCRMDSRCSSCITSAGSSSTSARTPTSCIRASSTPISTSTPRTRCALFTKYGINTVFENLEGFPTDWKTNTPAFIQFVREHQRPSFLEYGEYPYVSAEEIKKALQLKAAFSDMLEQMQ